MKAVNGLGKRAQCNAHSAPLRKSLPCTSCLCFDCSASLEIAWLPRLLLWVLWDTTGWVRTPPAMENGHRPQTYALGLTCFAGRHPTLPAGQFFLLKPVWQQRRAGKAWQCISSKCMHQPHSLSYLWLKGECVSILGPPITHYHALWPKGPSMHFDFKCNAHTQTKAQSLSLDQGTRHAC